MASEAGVRRRSERREARVTSDADPVKVLTGVLVRAVRSLGDAGRCDTASRLAATAWVALRHPRPAEAQRLNGVMHYLARLSPPLASDPVNEPPSDPAATKEETMPAEDQLLDVRSEIPARRHELIFETYGALDPGEGFVLVNDHDPKPLYYQFSAEHAGQFSWDYLEQGPETWRVRIGRPA